MAEEELDLEKLEANIEKSLGIEPEDVDETKDEVVEPVEEYNLKEVLSGDVAPNLTKLLADGVITDEQINGEAESRGWTENGKDKFGFKVSQLEFLERTPQYNTIGGLKKNQKRLEDKVDRLVADTKRIAQSSIDKQKKLMEQLEEAKSKLLEQDYLDEDGIRKVRDLDGRLNDVRDDVYSVQEATANDDEWDDALMDFVATNAWYGTHKGLTDSADLLAKQFQRTHKEATPEEYYGFISERMIEKFGEQMMFPTQEEPPKTVRKPNIGTNNNRQPIQRQAKAKTVDDLPEDQRAVAREVIASGVKEEDYLKTYFRG